MLFGLMVTVIVGAIVMSAVQLARYLLHPAAPEMWVIFEHPADHPDQFVARRFVEVEGAAKPQLTSDILVSPDLDALRATLCLKKHLGCLSRAPDDDPQIVETWL